MRRGIGRASGVGLGHRRLSIIDLAGGDQPIGNEDGRVQVVFNGEIYNYRELKRELEGKGHRFSTNSDTEVLVHLYEEMGERLVERLRGMFAFAIWDDRRKELLLGRDRVGQKPVYYYHHKGRFLFGSEIKAILAFGDVDRSLDYEALEDYLTFGVIPGERSIFRHIRKLPPAHTLRVRQEDFRVSLRRYWQLEGEPDESRTEAEWLEAIDGKLAETVKAHQIADVPVGAFLSGGLDSSAIVASMQHAVGEPLKTFSMGFQDRRFSELPYARKVAEYLKTDHYEDVVTPEAVESLTALTQFYDEPFADSSAIPTMAVARLAREHVKVVVSGDGGDEAFGGYTRYAHDLREGAIRGRLPAWFRKMPLVTSGPNVAQGGLAASGASGEDAAHQFVLGTGGGLCQHDFDLPAGTPQATLDARRSKPTGRISARRSVNRTVSAGARFAAVDAVIGCGALVAG